jgi:hypothetical protein
MSRAARSRASCSVARVGLHPRGTDQFDQQAVGDLHRVHEWGQLVVPGPGIGSRFQDHLVALGELFGRPLREPLHTHLAWSEDDLLRRVDRRHHDGVFVDIQRHLPLDGLHEDSSCATPSEPTKKEPWRLECVVVSCSDTHTDAS